MFLALGSACDEAPGSVDSNGDSNTETSDTDDGGTTPAILVGVFVRTPEGRNVYVGAVPEIPQGALDYSQFLEFGDVEVRTYGGDVFVWDREPATMTRFTVGNDLRLRPQETLSFLQHGAANASGLGGTVFVSSTRAYTLSAELDDVIVWNPSDMEITSTIAMEPPVRPEGLNTFASGGYIVGSSVVWPLVSTNWDGELYHPGTAVAIADVATDTPIRIVEDDRCVGGDGARVTESGDLHLRAGGYWGSAAAYGSRAHETRTCVLRLDANEAAFDPNFLIDIKDLTGSYVTFPWFHVQGSQYLVHVWPSSVPFPESIDDYWDGAGLEPRLVDIETGETTPYPHVADHTIVSSIEFEVDGVRYYQLSKTGTAVGGSTDVVELRPEGVVTKFTLPELWALERIR